MTLPDQKNIHTWHYQTHLIRRTYIHDTTKHTWSEEHTYMTLPNTPDQKDIHKWHYQTHLIRRTYINDTTKHTWSEGHTYMTLPNTPDQKDIHKWHYLIRRTYIHDTTKHIWSEGHTYMTLPNTSDQKDIHTWHYQTHLIRRTYIHDTDHKLIRRTYTKPQIHLCIDQTFSFILPIHISVSAAILWLHQSDHENISGATWSGTNGIVPWLHQLDYRKGVEATHEVESIVSFCGYTNSSNKENQHRFLFCAPSIITGPMAIRFLDTKRSLKGLIAFRFKDTSVGMEMLPREFLGLLVRLVMGSCVMCEGVGGTSLALPFIRTPKLLLPPPLSLVGWTL